MTDQVEPREARSWEDCAEQTEPEQVGGDRTGRRVRPHRRNRMEFAFQEFLTLPLSIVLAWILLSAGAIVFDRDADSWSAPVRQAIATVVPPQAAASLLSTVTPGLLTVISIVFFVMVMAVQHQSAKYSPVVLDQFLRRKFNQLFFGMFVGLTVYCLLVLGLVPQGQAVLSGTVALLLSSTTFVMLLLFIYSTVDQMRPSAVASVLADLALKSRARQEPLLARCRAHPRLHDRPAAEIISPSSGYLVHIDAKGLAAMLENCEDEVEIQLHVAMGEHIVAGACIGKIHSDNQELRRELGEKFLRQITLGRMRDIDRDATHAVNQLASMAWSATAISGDPEGARVAIETLHALLTGHQGPDRHRAAEEFGGELPVVYQDEVADKIIDGLTNVIAASGISGQHQSCSDALTALARALPNEGTYEQDLLLRRLERVLPMMTRHVYTIELENGFDLLRHAMEQTGLTEGAQRLGQLMDELSQRHRLASPE